MHQLWQQAADTYFFPEQFRLNLQNCIMVSRTVTFIMQSNKSSINNFDYWYQGYIKKWQSDSFMIWARDSRNVIEKQGDLSLYSEVRGQIVASYVGCAFTGWANSRLFSSNDAIRSSIPKEYLNSHVVQHGTLIIERRWVANSLPATEILEAMAHVYGELQKATIDLTQRAEMPLPRWLRNGLPHAMRALAMDRAAYVSLADGSTYGYRLFQKPKQNLEETTTMALEKRYGPLKKILNSRFGDTLQEQADYLFKLATVILLRDGYHVGIALLMGDGEVTLVPLNFPDRSAKYVITRELAKYAVATGATSVFMINEAWTVSENNAPPSGFASDSKCREEALVLDAANNKGEHLSIGARFNRRLLNKKKVKRIEQPSSTVPDLHSVMMPFLQGWSALTDEALKAFIEAEENFYGRSLRDK